MNHAEAKAKWLSDCARFAQYGAYVPEGVQTYVVDEWRNNVNLAMDAIPALTTGPNGAIPALLTTLVDPQVFEILFAPTKAAEMLGETRKGTWTDETAMFPVVEQTGEVTSYGDHSNNGRSGVNTAWPQRQSYLYQTVKEYGDREAERAGLAKINWIGEIDKAAASVMNRFLNKTYFYGVAGLQNYGLFNDPNLPAALTPATKAATGTAWINGTAVVATANEVYNDIQVLFANLVNVTGGLVDMSTPLVLAMSPLSSTALLTTNSFGISVNDLLKKNFPNITIETAVQYGVKSTANPEGVAAGNLVQMIAKSIEGQDTGYCAFNEKMRAHQPIRGLSHVQQKVTGGTWGAIIRMPVAFVQMVGI